MPRLQALLMVFKDDLHKVTESLVDDIRSQIQFNRLLLRGHISDQVVLEHLVGNAVVLCQLQRGHGVYVRDSVNAVSELPVRPAHRVYDLDCARDGDLSVVVGSLWVRPSGTRGEVPPERPELVERPSPPDGSLWQVFKGCTAYAAVGVADYGFPSEDGLGKPSQCQIQKFIVIE